MADVNVIHTWLERSFGFSTTSFAAELSKSLQLERSYAIENADLQAFNLA